jgi:multiple antibiotic resistance protein
MTYNLSQFATLFAVALFGLLPICNPLSSAAVLLGLTASYPDHERNRQVNRATIYVAITIVVCYFAGHAIMNAFGVSIPGLRLAGGMIVGYIGFNMLFPAEVSEAQAQLNMANGESSVKVRDIAFVPLAIPVTSGPGTIAYIISSAALMPKSMPLWFEVSLVISVTLTFTLILWACLRGATKIMHVLGRTGIDAFSRIMGFMLVCIGVQFAINGTEEILKLWGFIAT